MELFCTDISDHLPICLLTKQINDTKVDTVIETRIYNEQATTTFKESIDQITWDEIYASKNPQESYSKFLNEILFVYNKSFPLIKKTIRAKKHKPWITMGFRHSIRTKNKLYKYYLNKPAVFNEINYKQYRNKLNCLVNIAEKAQG
jgi:hypothetical protein